MTGEQHIDYHALAQAALRNIVRTVLERVAKSGLPGQHHFYVAFNTNAPGAIISPRLKEKYPEEMTIVLQHRFWDLLVSEERFEVKLTFDGIPERLVVPFAAIRVFFDPSVPYGLQFEGSDLGGVMAPEADDAVDLDPAPRSAATPARKNEARNRSPATNRAEKKPRAPRKPRAAKGEAAGNKKGARPKLVASTPEQPEAPANDTKVVQLDQFRKKQP